MGNPYWNSTATPSVESSPPTEQIFPSQKAMDPPDTAGLDNGSPPAKRGLEPRGRLTGNDSDLNSRRSHVGAENEGGLDMGHVIDQQIEGHGEPADDYSERAARQEHGRARNAARGRSSPLESRHTL